MKLESTSATLALEEAEAVDPETDPFLSSLPPVLNDVRSYMLKSSESGKTCEHKAQFVEDAASHL